MSAPSKESQAESSFVFQLENNASLLAGDSDSQDSDAPKVRRGGRRKIDIEFIQDKTRRHITFSKRKAGIMKKAFELSTLTGTQVLLLVVSETGLVYTFSTPKLRPVVAYAEGKDLIQKCLNSSITGENLRNTADKLTSQNSKTTTNFNNSITVDKNKTSHTNIPTKTNINSSSTPKTPNDSKRKRATEPSTVSTNNKPPANNTTAIVNTLNQPTSGNNVPINVTSPPISKNSVNIESSTFNVSAAIASLSPPVTNVVTEKNNNPGKTQALPPPPQTHEYPPQPTYNKYPSLSTTHTAEAPPSQTPKKAKKATPKRKAKNT